MTDPSSSTGPHRMRIASGGNLRGYVSFAVKFLQDNPTRPLVLHTLPADCNTSKPPSELPGPNQKSASSSTLHPSLLSTPKLVSVVELVKREYMAPIHARTEARGGKGKHKAIGIWQYTKSGVLFAKQLAATQGEENGDQAGKGLGLEDVLKGKTKPRMIHHPYLEITLSRRPLGLENERDTCCQYEIAQRPTPTQRKSKLDRAVSQDETSKEPGNAGDIEPSERPLEGNNKPDEVVAQVGNQPADTKVPAAGKKRKSLSQEEKLAKRKKAANVI